MGYLNAAIMSIARLFGIQSSLVNLSPTSTTQPPIPKTITSFYLCNPEPNSLEDVPWCLSGPQSIQGIQGGLSGGDICVCWADRSRPLEDLPEDIEDKEDWDANVCGKEA